MKRRDRWSLLVERVVSAWNCVGQLERREGRASVTRCPAAMSACVKKVGTDVRSK